MANWTLSNYPAASAWLENTPDGPLKRQATAVYAATVAPYHPADAARWAIMLEPGHERTALLRKIHAAWERQDEAAATEFARQHGLGE